MREKKTKYAIDVAALVVAILAFLFTGATYFRDAGQQAKEEARDLVSRAYARRDMARGAPSAIQRLDAAQGFADLLRSKGDGQKVRSSPEGADFFVGEAPNLRDGNFRRADDEKRVFKTLDLAGVYMSSATFGDAHLKGSSFKGANVSWVNFEGADLSEVDFRCANVTGTKFTGASLGGADFAGAFHEASEPTGLPSDFSIGRSRADECAQTP